MERIILKTGHIIFTLNHRGRRFLLKYLLCNNTRVIFVLVGFISILLWMVFLSLGFPIEKTALISFVLSFCFYTVLILISAVHAARKLQGNNIYSKFYFKRSNLNTIEINNLGFSESDRENLNLVLNNLKPNSKIDFRLVSDNRIAADYKKLFRILHLLIDGGIRNFKKERKEELFKFIQLTFTLNGSLVKKTSLNSRFSEFVNESETEFSENLRVFQKILFA